LGGGSELVPGGRSEHGSVAVRIGVREGAVGGPGAYVFPFEVEGDAGDGDVGVVGGGLHDAVVDGFFGDGRVEVAHEGGLFVGALRAGDALDGICDLWFVFCEEFEEAGGFEHEHAGVPEVVFGAFGEEAFGSRLVGFFAEAAHAADARQQGLLRSNAG